MTLDRRHLLTIGLAAALLVVGGVLVSGLVESLLAGSDWIAFRGWKGKGYTPNAVSPPIGIRWKLALQAEVGQAYAFNNPVVKDGAVFFGSTDGNFYALDLETGFMRWVFRTQAAVNSIPCADENAVYFGSNDGRVYALDLATGAQLWAFDTGRTVQSVIIRYEDYVVFSSDGGRTYFLSPDGREQFSLPNPVWHYHTFQIFDDHVYFAPGPPEDPFSFGVFDIATRSYRWVLDAAIFNTHWYSFGALDGDRLFFSTALSGPDGWELAYYAYDRKSGRRLWAIQDLGRLPAAIDSRRLFESNLRLLDYLAPAISPSIFGSLVIYASGDDRVRAFHGSDGRPAWVREFGAITSSAPIVAGDRVYFGLAGSGRRPPRLVCLSARSGEELWSMEVEGNILSPPVISGKWLVFGTDRNVVYVLEELL